jgi:hypothetical protein
MAHVQAQGTIQTSHIGPLDMNVLMVKCLVIARAHHFLSTDTESYSGYTNSGRLYSGKTKHVLGAE